MIKIISLGILGIISFIIAFIVNQKSGAIDIELNVLGININHFLTFFGGSILVYTFFLFLNEVSKKKCHIWEPFVLVLTFIGTLWFSWSEEFKQSEINFLEGFDCLVIFNQHNFLDVFSDLLGWTFFVFLVSILNVVEKVR